MGTLSEVAMDTKRMIKDRVEKLKTSVFEEDQDLRTNAIFNIARIPEAMEQAIDTCFQLGLTAGWWHDPKTKEPAPNRNYGDLTSLFHSEISEAYEHHRKGSKDDHLPQYDGKLVELADCVIRIFDYVGADEARKQEFLYAMRDKLIYNTERADHKIDARNAEGGKKL